MRKVIQLAKGRDQEEVPVGALLILNNEIIGEGINQPIEKKDPTAHAEILAIRMAAFSLGNYRLPNTNLYVTLEPCIMCMGAIIHARIEKLIFGAYDSKIDLSHKINQLITDTKVNHKLKIKGGVLEEECSSLLKDFFKKRRDN